MAIAHKDTGWTVCQLLYEAMTKNAMKRRKAETTRMPIVKLQAVP
ncbi:hypothetical protein [Pararhizobium antarcticum]|nr:hypothetical protein [Pararhizobium antarcticum]